MALEGMLTDMPLIDLLRIFQRGERNGRLILQHGQEGAIVWFQAGQVVNALVLKQGDRRPSQSGEAALAHLFNWADGRFHFAPLEPGTAYPVTITRPTATLISELLQRRVEPSQAALANLSPATPLRVLSQFIGKDETLRLSREEWIVLLQISNQTTAAQIATQTGLGLERVLHLVARLIDLGMVMCALLSDLPPRRVTVALPAQPSTRSQSTPSAPNLARAIRRRLQQLSVAAYQAG